MLDSLFNGRASELPATISPRKPGVVTLLAAVTTVGLLIIPCPSTAQNSASTPAVSAPISSTPAVSTPVISAPAQSATHELLPLTTRQLDIPGEPLGLEQVSKTVNAQIDSNRHSEQMAERLQLETLPLIGELLDESGNLDIGVDLPFDMSISNVMGETGLVLSTDFTVD